ncbi:MAG: hypothetical protein NVV60_01520 [Luteimonas sp.]|nr:hypothetical protein [Luteimonas sp.]
MEKKLPDRIAELVDRVATLFDRIGFVWLFILLAVVTLAVVVWLNPPRLGLYLWWVSKLSGAAALGYGIDIAFFRGSNPRHMQDGIEKSMAQQRRSVLIGCALIAAGLIG